MAARPPFSHFNDALPSAANYPSDSSPRNSVNNINLNPRIIHNAFTRRAFEVNRPSHAIFTTNGDVKHEYTSTHKSPNISYPFAGSINNNPNRMPHPAPLSARLAVPANNYYSSLPNNHPGEQNCNMHPLPNHFEKNSGISLNSCQKGFYYPSQVDYGNLPGTVNNKGYSNNACHMQSNDISRTFNPCPQNVLSATGNTNFCENNVITPSNCISNSVMFPGHPGCNQTVSSALLNSGNLFSPQIQTSCTYPAPPPIIISNTPYVSLPNDLHNTSHKKEMELGAFLTKFSLCKQKKGGQITVPEFRSVLKAAFSLMKLLVESKCKMSNLIEADENNWNLELQNVSNLQKQLSEICSLISAPVHLNAVMKKLKLIKKKRELKKKSKHNQLSERIKMEQNRRVRNQEIDKYLDDIKEKNLKLKREAEMKKEADFILLEVRKKIHEAKRTIEKIKVFERLRNARQANAVQKGLHVLPDHDEKFEKKVTCLKETMLKQLADYEAEEKALKVMLETEQEGQIEEETQWKLKRVKTFQQIKKNHIKECLFGNSEDPVPSDPLFLFHKYHTSANNNIENLVQIRHHWDVHIAEDGETVPQQWIVPVIPSSSSWEQWLMTSIVLKN